MPFGSGPASAFRRVKMAFLRAPSVFQVLGVFGVVLAAAGEPHFIADAEEKRRTGAGKAGVKTAASSESTLVFVCTSRYRCL